MAIALVNHNKNTSNASTTCAVTLTGVTTGNFLYVGVAAFLSTATILSVSDTVNTYTQDPHSPANASSVGEANAIVSAFYSANVTGGNLTVTVTWDNGPVPAFVEFSEFSGVDQTSPYVDSITGTHNGTGSPPANPTAGSITVSGAAVLLATICCTLNGGNSYTATNSYALLDTDNTTGQVMGASEYRIVTSSGTYSDGWQDQDVDSVQILTGFKAGGPRKFWLLNHH